MWFWGISNAAPKCVYFLASDTFPKSPQALKPFHLALWNCPVTGNTTSHSHLENVYIPTTFVASGQEMDSVCSCSPLLLPDQHSSTLFKNLCSLCYSLTFNDTFWYLTPPSHAIILGNFQVHTDEWYTISSLSSLTLFSMIFSSLDFSHQTPMILCDHP